MKPSFSESQRFNQWWFYAIVILPFLFLVGTSLMIFNGTITTNDGKKDILPLIASIAVALLFLIWLFIIRLKTTIDEKGIIVHFYGIPFCKREISWAEIKTIEVVEYSPIFEYGGWGVRYSITGKGWCYNVSGKMGIKIHYTNGKIFLIGTQLPKESQETINHYFNR